MNIFQVIFLFFAYFTLAHTHKLDKHLTKELTKGIQNETLYFIFNNLRMSENRGYNQQVLLAFSFPEGNIISFLIDWAVPYFTIGYSIPGVVNRRDLDIGKHVEKDGFISSIILVVSQKSLMVDVYVSCQFVGHLVLDKSFGELAGNPSAVLVYRGVNCDRVLLTWEENTESLMKKEGCKATSTGICAKNPCSSGVKCEAANQFPYYQCKGCPPGFDFANKKCEDVDECRIMTSCDPRVICRNISPGYECSPCPPGWKVDDGKQQHICIDVNECDKNNGGCTKYSECINTEGSFHCGPCKPGLTGDQISGCQSLPGFCPDGSKCNEHASCLTGNEDYNFMCTCDIGWTGDGIVCGIDTDLDLIPDEKLNCDLRTCQKDNCPNTPNQSQLDTNQDGIGDECVTDPDKDSVEKEDNCPLVNNGDQKDVDQDFVGDACDNCVSIANTNQSDIDNDKIGDLCDEDMDEDGIPNTEDNCPENYNKFQLDNDDDGIGDECDTCPLVKDENRLDVDNDLVGDPCDTDIDKDKDGVQDDRDNCVSKANSNQLDTDGDQIGDDCDEDKDGDGIPNDDDNCPLVENKSQEDSNQNDVGDECEQNQDGDPAPDGEDNCPENKYIFITDFRSFMNVHLDPIGTNQIDPFYIFLYEGKEVIEKFNSDPGMLIDKTALQGVDYEGTFYVDTDDDDDYAGFVFGYQSNKRFYTVMWKKQDQDDAGSFGEAGLQLKLIYTNVNPGIELRDALWRTSNTTDIVYLLWHDKEKIPWEYRVSYRWVLIHRPSIGLIRIKFFDGKNLVIDSGNIYDFTLQGGSLGLFCYSQEMVRWSNLYYRCNEDIPKDIYDTLSPAVRSKVKVDNRQPRKY